DLKAMKPNDALAPEQRALKILQVVEQQYETQIAQQNGGGGGGGQQSQMAEDLADLFELELDKLANQYEMKQQAEQQASDKKIDELADKLKELARRQQQEAERQARLSQAGAQPQQSGGGGGGSNSCHANRSGPISPTRRVSCRMRRTPCGRRRPTARRTTVRWPSPRST